MRPILIRTRICLKLNHDHRDSTLANAATAEQESDGYTHYYSTGKHQTQGMPEKESRTHRHSRSWPGVG